MSHEVRLAYKTDAYIKVNELVTHQGLDYNQRTNLLKVKKSLFHQVKQLDKLTKI